MIGFIIKGQKTRATKQGLQGFTLIELAIVLLILGALFAGILIPLTTQVELRRVNDTQKTLVEIRDALIGFAAANGRLPCPASAASNGQESWAAGGSAANGKCSNFFDGFAPGQVLGIGPTDSAGYVLDAWNNRIRYAVSNADRSPIGSATPLNPNTNFDFTSLGTVPAANGEMRNVGMAALAPNLRVCSTAPGAPGVVCAGVTSLIDNAAAVIYSTGPNAMRTDPGGARIDENANPNSNANDNNQTFVSHDRAGVNNPNGEFDDIVIWLSPNILYARMIAAGRLP
jgi:prepilin-type N-terminal cleavage/methylation domain-containing protein